eukprot:scaffold93044_cov72-Cyclotella_meneghiniana.AAC.1
MGQGSDLPIIQHRTINYEFFRSFGFYTLHSVKSKLKRPDEMLQITSSPPRSFDERLPVPPPAPNFIVAFGTLPTTSP